MAGGASLLKGQGLFRVISRHPGALAGLLAALMASSVHTMPPAQAAVTECFLLSTLRFVRPPQLAKAQVVVAT